MVWRVRKGRKNENAGRLEQMRERIGLFPHSVELFAGVKGMVFAGDRARLEKRRFQLS